MCPSSRPQFPFPLLPSFLTKVPVLQPCCMPSSWLARISCPCSLTLSTSITFLVFLIIFPSLVLVTRPSILRLQRSYFHWKKLRFPGETLPKFLPAAKLIQETFVPVHLHHQLVCFSSVKAYYCKRFSQLIDDRLKRGRSCGLLDVTNPL